MAGKAWTKAEISLARQMRLLGHTLPTIGAALGRSWYSVRNKLRTLDDYADGLSCDGCGTPIRGRNESGRCSRCIIKQRNADPEYRARLLAGISKKWADPEYKAKMRASSRALAERLAKDPKVRAARQRAGRASVPRLFSPEVRAKTLKAVSERAGKTNSERRLAWCPVEYRSLYRYLLKTKRIPGPEARQSVFEQIRIDRERKLAAKETLSPFERQMRALENGAQLIANDRGPMFGEARKAVCG